MRPAVGCMSWMMRLLGALRSRVRVRRLAPRWIARVHGGLSAGRDAKLRGRHDCDAHVVYPAESSHALGWPLLVAELTRPGASLRGRSRR